MPQAPEGQFSDPVDITGATIIALPQANRAAVTFRTVTIAAAGTPQQGPNVPVPDGFDVVVVFRVTQNGNPKGYVGNSVPNVSNPATRTEMLKGDVRSFKITNMNLLFFDSDTNGAVFDIFAEQ